ncbi:MAG TPA: hypothetical protein PL169_27185, partial [Leptospiraceae bacterium]|nr:hypothetical protein [Leptospiraceae bacterium]
MKIFLAKDAEITESFDFINFFLGVLCVLSEKKMLLHSPICFWKSRNKLFLPEVGEARSVQLRPRFII